MAVDLRKKEMTEIPGNRLKKKRPVKPPELILILIHGEKVNTMTVLDEDYRPEKYDRPDNNSDADMAQHSEEETGEEGGGEKEEETGAALEASAVKRHKRPRSRVCKRQVIQEKRLKGESYKNAAGRERQPKTMGPPCTSQHCSGSKKPSCELLSEEERTDIFNNFWSMPSWETRKLYLQTLVANVPLK